MCVSGKCWMDALELALRCSSLLMRTMTKDAGPGVSTTDPTIEEEEEDSATFLSPLRQQMNESDCERHFNLCGKQYPVFDNSNVVVFLQWGGCLWLS